MNITKVDLLRFYGWSENPTIWECAEKAYKDLSRTMKYNNDNPNKDREVDKKHESDKASYKKSINDLIVKSIDALLGDDTEDFDTWHEKTCNEIIKSSNTNTIIKKNEFYYGQAQKWLNMTFKNMLLVDELNQKITTVEKLLHVPIDNFILDVAKNKFSLSSDHKSWSRWGLSEYKDFQDKLRKVIKDKYPDRSPIEWEFTAWLEERDK
jgi:hypothetical protein